MLNDRSTLLDEAICAATVILRLYEELSGWLCTSNPRHTTKLMFSYHLVAVVGKDTLSHLLGTHIFVLAQEYRTSGIRQAAFRVALRQEINVAFCTRKPLKLLTKYTDVDRSADLKSDWDWTVHIIVLCAEVLNYCYCNIGQAPTQPWDELSTRVEDWLRKKPKSFEPLQCKEPNYTDQVFPEIWLLNDCHGECKKRP